jgi:hypothetical protein
LLALPPHPTPIELSKPKRKPYDQYQKAPIPHIHHPYFICLNILPYDRIIHLDKLKFMHFVTHPSSLNQVWQLNNNIREHDHELRNLTCILFLTQELDSLISPHYTSSLCVGMN